MVDDKGQQSVSPAGVEVPANPSTSSDAAGDQPEETPVATSGRREAIATTVILSALTVGGIIYIAQLKPWEDSGWAVFITIILGVCAFGSFFLIFSKDRDSTVAQPTYADQLKALKNPAARLVFPGQSLLREEQVEGNPEPDEKAIRAQLREIERIFDQRQGYVRFDGRDGRIHAQRLDMLSSRDIALLKIFHQLYVLDDITEQVYDIIQYSICRGGAKRDELTSAYLEHTLNKGSPLGQQIVRRALMGGNAWLTVDDIAGSIYEARTDSSLVLGALADDEDTTLQYSGNGSLITLAPPGSGKTQCHVLENLVRYRGAAFVLDVKGEAWRETSKWRAENVGSVWRFDPLNPDLSSHYNPFSLIGQKRTWMEATQLAQALSVPAPGVRTDPYWEQRSVNLLTALIYFVATNGEPGRRNMMQVCRLAWGDRKEWRVLWRMMKEIDEEQPRQSAKAFSDMMENAEKQWMGVADHVRHGLEIWRDPEVSAITSQSDPAWHPARLRQPPYPTVYLCISPREIEAYSSVLRVIISQHIRALTAELPNPGDPSVLFCLDELPRLGQMLPVQEGIEVGRQYGVRLWLFAQHLDQLRQAYPGADGMVGSCAVRIFMNPRAEDRTAQKVSEMLGFKEGILDGGRQRVAEMTDLTGAAYKDLQVVFGDGAPPARLRKTFAFQDASIADRWGAYQPS